MLTDKKISSITLDEHLLLLQSNRQGLTKLEALNRLKDFGENLPPEIAPKNLLALLWSQFKSPLILLLIVAAILSSILGDAIDAIIVMVILISSNLLQFWQEHQASDAIQRLLKMVQVKATVRREGQVQDVPLSHIVPGDIVLLNAGDMVPGDCKLFDIKDLFIDESALSGESFPAEKSQDDDGGFFGTHVISGKAEALICRTGKDTAFGEVAKNLQGRNLETAFEKGIGRFSLMLMQMTLLILSGVLLVNLSFHKPLIDLLLFALALAIGMTPQLLPATVSMTLALGARRLAEKRVIVKRLNAIQNLGSMTILCCDKTGTLTEGKMRLHGFLTLEEDESRRVLEMAVLNASLQSGFNNPVDEAILAHRYLQPEGYTKIDEIPYDFNRKRLTVAVVKNNECSVITKGAFANILSICDKIEMTEGHIIPLGPSIQDKLQAKFQALSADGHKVLALSYKKLSTQKLITKQDEEEMIFLGLLVFEDPLKPDAMASIEKINQLGVEVKIISGDNRFTVERIAKDMGLQDFEIMTGDEIAALSEVALSQRALRTHAFAEVDPNQKEALLRALQIGGATNLKGP